MPDSLSVLNLNCLSSCLFSRNQEVKKTLGDWNVQVCVANVTVYYYIISQRLYLLVRMQFKDSLEPVRARVLPSQRILMRNDQVEPCMFPLCSAAVHCVSVCGPLLDQRFCWGRLVPGDEEQASDSRLSRQPLRCVLCPRSQGLQGFCWCIFRCDL